MLNFPKQRLSYSKKSEDDFRWARKVMESLLQFSPAQKNIASDYTSEYGRKLSNYRLYNNQLDQKDFERECNPLGLEVGQFQDSIQPYNKTYNKIQVLLGDELKRPFNYRAVLVNTEGVQSKLQKRDSLYRNYIYSQLQETVKSIGAAYVPELVDTMTEHILPPEDIEKYMKYSYRERREILAENILNYLTRKLSLKDKKNDAFKHALIAGEEIIYVGTNNGEPHLEVINPLGVFYHKSPETKWIQDSLYAGFRTYMTVGEVMDRYGKYLTKAEITKLDNTTTAGGALPDHNMGSTQSYGIQDQDRVLSKMYNYDSGSYGDSHHEDILVQHVEWKSQKKVGFLTMINEYGEEEEQMISEDFKVPNNAIKQVEVKDFGQRCDYYYWEENGIKFKLEWDWIPEVWTGTKINNDIYCMIGPKDQQFRPLDNPKEVSLGYHGVIYNAMNATSISLMDRMKPYQYLYFIVMHKLKKAIAQDQGKVFHFDVTMIDPKIGLDKTMYYLKEMNIDFFNPLANGDQPGQNQRGKVSHSTDMSNMANINNYINLLQSIDQQISDVAGINRQREGQISPSEAVSNTQSNLQMSALITEIYFQAHSKLWEKCLNSMIAVTQQAWKGKSIAKQYILDDQSIATLEMNNDDIMDCELGVFVTDSGKEYEIFNALMGKAESLVQAQKASFSDMIRLYESNSVAELKAGIESSEELSQRRQQEAQQAQIEAAQQAQQAEHDFQMEKLAIEQEHELMIAQIESFKFQKDQDANDNGLPDQFEIYKLRQDAGFKDRKLSLEEKKLEFNKQKSEKELQIKRSQNNKK
jgi:hypothetical protein